MNKKISYTPQYISLDQVQNIRSFFDDLNDSLTDSRGPFKSSRTSLGWQGCWDRQLHLEIPDNPIHKIVDKLKQDFGNFEISLSSIRYFSAPFLPHSDIVSVDMIKQLKDSGKNPGWTFLIPLWWKQDYQPGTAFLSSPADVSESLYCEMLDMLPNYSNTESEESKNFSVKKIIWWQNPGDLVAWENFQWHCSCHQDKAEYSRDSWIKEFISIRAFS